MKNATNGMGGWKATVFGKKTRASQTTGRSKGMCPPTIFRTMCKRSRSYKLPQYSVIMAKYTGNKIRW